MALYHTGTYHHHHRCLLEIMIQRNIAYVCLVLALGFALSSTFHSFSKDDASFNVSRLLTQVFAEEGGASNSTMLHRQISVLQGQISELQANQDELKQALLEQLEKNQHKLEQLLSGAQYAVVPSSHLRGSLLPSYPDEATAQKRAVELSDLYQRFKYHAPRPHQPSDAVRANCGQAPDYAAWFAQGLQTRSANNEDRVIYTRFFREILDGHAPTYVELGAFNGKQESNSRFFDECLGWNGLLVEANPNERVWNELVENRPTAHRMWMAASCSHEDAVHHNASIPFHNVLWTNAAQKEGTENAYNGRRTTVDVPCGSLTPFIKDLLGSRVTFFSLDVEGAEPMVLEHLDFDQIRADVMIVENANQFCKAQCESRDRFRAIMAKAGYIRYDIVKKSDLFVHPESPFAKLALQ